MKTLITTAILLSICSPAFADTPSRLVDGIVEFAYGQVGSTTAWTETQFNEMVGECVGPCSQQVYLPAQWEINLSTCIAFNTDKYRAFDNWTDWNLCKTKAGLKKKIKAMRIEFDSMQDLPASEKADLRQRFDWIKSYYATLP